MPSAARNLRIQCLEVSPVSTPWKVRSTPHLNKETPSRTRLALEGGQKGALLKELPEQFLALLL
jgi:hypothetical protein